MLPLGADDAPGDHRELFIFSQLNSETRGHTVRVNAAAFNSVVFIMFREGNHTGGIITRVILLSDRCNCRCDGVTYTRVYRAFYCVPRMLLVDRIIFWIHWVINALRYFRAGRESARGCS